MELIGTASYTGYTIFQFKMAHPHVANFADAGEVLFGAFGREFFGAALVILLIFAASSHILTFSIALNIISEHTTCTIVWAVVALVVFFCFSIPRTMKRVSYFSIAGMCSNAWIFHAGAMLIGCACSVHISSVSLFDHHDCPGHSKARSCGSGYSERRAILLCLHISCQHCA